MTQNRHDLSSVSAGISEFGRGCVPQIVKPKVIETRNNTSSATLSSRGTEFVSDSEIEDAR
jgi:hypothetical protein